ncbi:hypothetical protein GBA52_025985 [Prunus armeniaca]|nr:hypothetical protein GBA52_025985 [Prunus armeniaca]
MPKLFPSLREDELNPLVVSIDISEVKESLFNIGSLNWEWMGFLLASIKINGKFVVMIFSTLSPKRLGNV